MIPDMYEDENDQGFLVRLDDSTLIERDVLNIIERIQEYDPNITVQYLSEAASLNQAPYRLVEACRDGRRRVIFYAWALDERVLDRIRRADSQQNNVLEMLDKNNDRVRRESAFRYRDQMDEANDIARHVLSSPKGRYTFKDPTLNKIVKIDDDPLRRAEVTRIE